MFNLRALVASLLPMLLGAVPAAAQPGAWTPLEAMPADVKAGEAWIRPMRFAPFQLDDAALRKHLATVPMWIVLICKKWSRLRCDSKNSGCEQPSVRIKTFIFWL